jgi:hypothetical protein
MNFPTEMLALYQQKQDENAIIKGTPKINAWEKNES